MKLRPYQEKLLDELRESFKRGGRAIVLYAPTGAGKCLGIDTPVILSNGQVVPVQNIKVGDRLMGPDGKPRNVLSVTRGFGKLYRIDQVKGDSYVVNADHILSLKPTRGVDGMILSDGTHVEPNAHIVNVNVEVFANSNITAKHCLKGWKSEAVEFERAQPTLRLDPYWLGLWLGDGRSSDVSFCKPECEATRWWVKHAEDHGHKVSRYQYSPEDCPEWRIKNDSGDNLFLAGLRGYGLQNNKHIPEEFKYAPIMDRCKLIAGLMDSDGSVDGPRFDWIAVSEGLANDVAFICRSVGLRVKVTKECKAIRSRGFSGIYWRLSITGDCTKIPTKDKKPTVSQDIRRSNVTGISVHDIGYGDYFGFTLDGDKLFLLGDFTVTHNTETAIALLNAARQKKNRSAMILDRIVLVNQTSERLDKYAIDHGVLQSGHWRFRPYEYIQVCSAQTLERRGGAEHVSLLIVDECFPAGTMISTPSGDVPIHLVRCGDVVHNATGVGRVVQTMVRPAIHLTRLEFDDGTVIECTNEHPILTARGWRRAESLEVGEGAFSKQGVRLLWQTIFSKDQGDRWKKGGNATRGILERADDLFNILREEAVKSNEQGGGAPQSQSEAARNSPQADQEGWKRSIAAVTATCFAARAGRGMGIRVRGCNEDETFKDWIPNLLQAGLSLPGEKDRNRVGRWQSLLAGEASARFEEDRILHFPRVVNISRIQREGFEPVFNLHIDGHPSYFAEGKLVHNCHAVRRQTVEFIRANPQMKVVGLSATPFAKGMGKVYDGIVSTITTKELVDQGVLTPLKVFISKEIDMTGAKKVAGEWTDAEASARAITIVGDVVAEWIAKTHEIFGKPVKTVVFSCDVAHGIELSKKFREHGYNFVCISYRDDDDFKADVIKDFQRPDTTIHGLIATDILTKGFDNSEVRIGVSARPFSKSFGSHIQQMGRVMRGHPGKDFGVWLCFSGNYIRFREDWDDVYENGVHSLDDSKEKPKKEKTLEEKAESKCPQCSALWEKGSKSCLYCGYMRITATTIESVPGEMQELSAATKADKQKWWAMCRYKVVIDGWSQGRAAHTFKDKFGEYPRGMDDTKFAVPTEEFEKFCKELLKKYLRKVHAIKGKRK